MAEKLQALIDGQPQSFSYGNTFVREAVGGQERFRIGLDGPQHAVVQSLANGLAGPFLVLYILHTSRTDAELGRYQSPVLSADKVATFFQKFGRFLTEDARHDVWLRSRDDNATIVLDRHNILFTYGPLDRFEEALLASGARPGGPPEIPDPHVHNYHPEWDESERELLKAFEWIVSPLRPEDEQHRGVQKG